MLIALRCVLIAMALGACSTRSAAQPVAPLTLQQVATRPAIIGTPPASPIWSPDSRRLVFAWNDRGLPFRDLWIVAEDGSGLRRLTDLERTHPSPPPPGGRSTAALSAQAAARARGGITEYLWLRDNRTVFFTSPGATFRIDADGGTPARVELGGPAANLAISPDGTTLAFLRDGDLWTWPLNGTPASVLMDLGPATLVVTPMALLAKKSTR